ncbi:MAG: hypothetical protein JW869_08690 [Candidatus Omnitrophica bacterium]|nr:hypothetical protein [Candidatus Omnitrophota bacterium]
MSLRIVLGVVIGAIIGFALGYFGKCASGVCPLTSNPYISTFVGALFGFIIASS